MEWISTKERLPDESDDYYIYPHKYRYTASYDMEKNKWMVTDSNGYCYEIFVTHWMPIPSPPEET